jgi:hypothetical protein
VCCTCGSAVAGSCCSQALCSTKDGLAPTNCRRLDIHPLCITVHYLLLLAEATAVAHHPSTSPVLGDYLTTSSDSPHQAFCTRIYTVAVLLLGLNGTTAQECAAASPAAGTRPGAGGGNSSACQQQP